jgi:hypothetical protein
LHHAFGDPIALYVGNNALLLGAPAYLLYALLCRLGHGRSGSLIVAGLFLISPANAVTWPYITRFALCLVLLCGLALTLPISSLARALTLVVASFVLGYVRPEYMVLLGLASAVTLATAVARFTSSPLRVGLVLCVLAGLFASAAALGNPYSVARSRIAFSQHFALQYTRSGAPSGFSSWRDSATIMQRQFGSDSASLGEALRRNPRAVLRHVVANARTLAGDASTHLLPPQAMPASARAALSQLSLAFLGLCWLRRIRRPQLLGMPVARASTWVWALLGGHALVGLASALLIFPRDHYLLIPTCAGYAWGAELMRGAAPALPSPRAQRLVSAAACVALLWLAPFQLAGPGGLTPSAPMDMLAAGKPTLRNRIRDIAALPKRRPLRLLSAYPELAVFLPQDLAQTRPLSEAASDSFERLLQREQIELVWWDQELERTHRFARDPSFQAFAAHPAQYGFAARPASIPGERLYIKRGALRD